MSFQFDAILGSADVASPFYSEEHVAFRHLVRQWVAREISPHVQQWDEQGEMPREIYRKASEIGILQLGFPEQFGGINADLFYSIIAYQEVARAGSGGVWAALFSHTIGAPLIAQTGSEALKVRVLPGIMSGEKISALAVSEPSAGSDVGQLITTARREGDHYVVNGTKTFITSGMRADYITAAVRTGGSGHGGISMLLIDGNLPGLERTPLDKMGWWASDTATLYFQDVRVPVANLLGEENAGFKMAAHNFNNERVTMAANSIGYARACLQEAAEYATERRTFGKRLIDYQVIRHKLVDMAMRIQASQSMLETLVWRIIGGETPVAETCMLKNMATLTFELCAREGVQILGGAGYIRGSKVERLYREVRVAAIGGGAEEIMRDLAAKQLGW